MSDSKGIRPDAIYTKRDVIDITGLGERCVNKARLEEGLQAVYRGGCAFYLGSDLIAWFAGGNATRTTPGQ